MGKTTKVLEAAVQDRNRWLIIMFLILVPVSIMATIVRLDLQSLLRADEKVIGAAQTKTMKKASTLAMVIAVLSGTISTILLSLAFLYVVVEQGGLGFGGGGGGGGREAGGGFLGRQVDDS